MLLTEYRIPLPLTLEEYQRGQLYTIIEMSKKETCNGEGIEILRNESYSNNLSLNEYSSGQYTYKLYHLNKRLPTLIQNFTLHRPLIFHEEAWNCFPISKTQVTAPDFVDEGLSINIKTECHSDKGCEENIHNLPNDLLKKKRVVYIDIANDALTKDTTNNNPNTFKSKTGRGPFSGNWINTATPVMTCYKLVTTEFKWFGLQATIERLIQSTLKELFLVFHRMLLCSMDKWYELSMEDLRKFENEGAIDLNLKRFEEGMPDLIIPE